MVSGAEKEYKKYSKCFYSKSCCVWYDLKHTKTSKLKFLRQYAEQSNQNTSAQQFLFGFKDVPTAMKSDKRPADPNGVFT